MDAGQLTNYLREHMQGVGQAWADDIAAGVLDSLPGDYIDPAAVGDRDAALKRWALLVAAIGQHETAYGTARGYQPHADPKGWGDGGNAFGFWQADKRFHARAIDAGDLDTVQAQAHFAAGELADNFAAFSDQDFAARESLAVQTYNASRKRIRAAVDRGQTAEQTDETTTQRNGQGYAAGVLDIRETWV